MAKKKKNPQKPESMTVDSKGGRRQTTLPCGGVWGSLRGPKIPLLLILVRSIPGQAAQRTQKGGCRDIFSLELWRHWEQGSCPGVVQSGSSGGSSCLQPCDSKPEGGEEPAWGDRLWKGLGWPRQEVWTHFLEEDRGRKAHPVSRHHTFCGRHGSRSPRLPRFLQTAQE